MRDWPDQDALTASISNSGTTATVADSSIYTANWPIEIDEEMLIVRAKPSATTLTVKRAAFGTTGASHANGAAILVRPSFSSLEILDALNAALDQTFPYIYRPVLDTSLTTSADTYEYTVPNLPSGGVPIPYLSRVEIKGSGETNFRAISSWTVRRGATPKIQFRRATEAGGTIRVHGYGPFTRLASGDSLDALFPLNAEPLLVWGAAAVLLASGEAGRVRVDTGAIDSREQANRVGASMQASNQLHQRFLLGLRDAAMAPMPKHLKATF